MALNAIIAIASLAVNAIVAALVYWYTLETRRYRRATEDSLTQLKAEHRARYEAHVMAVDWSRAHSIDPDPNHVVDLEITLVNLGPSPAESVSVKAFCQIDSHEVYVFTGQRPALLRGERATLPLQTTMPGNEFPGGLENNTALIQVMAQTVMGQSMPPREHRFQYPPNERRFHIV